MNDPEPSYPDALLGLVGPTGTPPETRLEDADDARKVVDKLMMEDEPRSIQRALIRANNDCAPPYSKKPKGSNWEANVNFGMGRARLRRATGAYTSLLAGVENYFNIESYYQAENPDQPKWCLTLSRGIHDLIKTWGKGWDWNQQHRVKQMISEGYAPVLMEQGDNWRFRALDAASIKVPRDTPSCIDERCRYVVILERLSVTDLYRKTLLPDDQRWNQEAVKWAIRMGGRTGEQGLNMRSQSWEWWAAKLQHHDICTSDVDTDMVACAHLFVQEFATQDQPAAISHFIFTRQLVPADHPTKPSQKEGDFLFRHIRCYKNYDEALHVCFYDLGDGFFHSARGLSFETFKHDVIKNRAMCRLLDRAWVDSTAVIASESQASKDKLDNVTWGGAVVMLPAGAKPVQTGFAGSLQGVMDTIRLVTNSVDGNTGASNPRTIMREDGKGEQPTLGQVRAQIAQDTQLSNDQMRIDYLFMDRLGAEQVRRMTRKNTTDREAREFQRKMLEQGVPEEMLYGELIVTANRSAGYGSQAMQDAVMETLDKVVGMLPEDGKNNYLNMRIMAATQNPAMVALLNPKQHMPTPDDALIVLENAAIHEGKEPIIFSGQDNVRHIQGHLADVEQMLGPVQQAMESGQADAQGLQEGYAYLQIMGPHLEAHLAPLKLDPSRKQLVPMFEEQVAQLTAFHGKLRQAIRTAARDAQIRAQQEANANALDQVTQAKLRSFETHDEIAVAKAQTQIQLKSLTTASSIRQSAFKTAADTHLKTITTAHDIRMDKQKDKAA